MSDQFEWKAKITFKGTAEQFNKLTKSSLRDAIERGNIAINIGTIFPGGEEGKWPILHNLQMSRERLAAFTKDMPLLQVRPFPGINGGIRTPHFHTDEGVFMLNQTQFKEVVGEIARELAVKHVEAIGGDHVSVMTHLNRFAEGI